MKIVEKSYRRKRKVGEGKDGKKGKSTGAMMI
jgi:hypothetical protein